MGYGINRRSHKEYDKTPEEYQVHYPGVGVSKKAPVGKNIDNGGADENPYSFAYVLRAVVRLAQAPQLIAPVETERPESHSDGCQYVHHVTVRYIPEYFSGCQKRSSPLLDSLSVLFYLFEKL
jgi:hypothetical protein